jgi:dihydrofolate synthase/folylpolyglutamate synthase
MNGGQCRDYLRKIQESGVKFGLANVRAVLAALGEPQKDFPSVVVAGTNGKGSVCAMLAEIFTLHGLRVGLYTSPHLVRVEERIRIGRAPIPARSFCRLLTVLRSTIDGLIDAGKLAWAPTYFETLTCLALLYFREVRVDMAVLEVGMGGRLDATNVVHPVGTVITTVSRDHQEYLGRTLGRIAFEKAGIIKPGIPVVCGLYSGTARDVIRRRAREKGAPFVAVFEDARALRPERKARGYRFSFHWRGETYDFRPRLPGAHQGRNAAVALVAALSLRLTKRPPAKRTILRGIGRAEWPGRLEVVGRRPLIVLDGAHNEEGARAIGAYAAAFLPRPLTVVFAAMKDKDIPRLTRCLFQPAQTVVLTGLPMARAASPEEVLRLAFRPGNRVFVEPDPAAALRRAREVTPRRGCILVTGSLFLVGEVKKRIDFSGQKC